MGRRMGVVLCLDINARKGQFHIMDQEPLHRRIAGDIERRIASGEWRPGFRIPTEAELTAEYGCARMTVSRAMSDLAARGALLCWPRMLLTVRKAKAWKRIWNRRCSLARRARR